MRACSEFSSIYLYRDAIDFRKSINGLVALVEGELSCSAFEPALYLFATNSAINSKYSTGTIRVLPCGING